MKNLDNKTILIIAEDGFQVDEFFVPMDSMRDQGADVHVASSAREPIHSEGDTRKGYTPDMTYDDVNVADYDALIIPGGLKNPDTLRMNKDAVRLVRDFAESGKTIGAICHGPWLLAEADVIQGRELTSYPSIKTDMRNAGGRWTDSEVVTDNGFVTSRKPADIPAFNEKLTEEIVEGRHDRSFQREFKRAA